MCLFLTSTHKDKRPYYCFSPILCVLGLWDKSTCCCPVCIKTKPLTSWSGPEDVKEMIAAPELQTEFHYPQWVQKHTSNICMRSHILPHSDDIDLFVWTGTLTPDSHQTLISMILMGGMSSLGRARYMWTLTFLIIESLCKISQGSFKWPFTPFPLKWFWS